MQISASVSDSLVTVKACGPLVSSANMETSQCTVFAQVTVKRIVPTIYV